jgi:hypothetical protein
MDTIEYRTIDKSQWGPGPWQDEPDKKQWQDEATGLPCLEGFAPFGDETYRDFAYVTEQVRSLAAQLAKL